MYILCIMYILYIFSIKHILIDLHADFAVEQCINMSSGLDGESQMDRS